MGMTALHRLLKTPRAAAVIPFLLAGLLLPADNDFSLDLATGAWERR